MARKFTDPERMNPAWRKWSLQAKFAFEYMWAKCGPAGIYKRDRDLEEFENGYSFTDEILSEMADRVEFNGDIVLLVSFISVNYTSIKSSTNPHKPAFREIDLYNLSLSEGFDKVSLSLPKALPKPCQRIEDEEEDKDVDRDSREGGAGETKEFEYPTPEQFSVEWIRFCTSYGAPDSVGDRKTKQQFARDMNELIRETNQPWKVVYAEVNNRAKAYKKWKEVESERRHEIGNYFSEGIFRRDYAKKPHTKSKSFNENPNG
jgi:hypothetical protein